MKLVSKWIRILVGISFATLIFVMITWPKEERPLFYLDWRVDSRREFELTKGMDLTQRIFLKNARITAHGYNTISDCLFLLEPDDRNAAAVTVIDGAHYVFLFDCTFFVSHIPGGAIWTFDGGPLSQR